MQLKIISCVNLVWILSVVGHKLGVTNMLNIQVGTHSNLVSQVHGDQLPFERPLGGAETHVSFHQFGGMNFGANFGVINVRAIWPSKQGNFAS